jgi:sugar lactone lactonase YvrE
MLLRMWRPRSSVLGLIAAVALGVSAPVLAHPGSGIAVDRAGDVYFIDTGAGLWKVDAKGTLVAISAPRFHWMALDQDNALKSIPLPTGASGDITRVGTKPAVFVSSDYPLAIGSDGSLYQAPRGSSGAVEIRRTPASGKTSVLARVNRSFLSGFAAGPNGSFYFTEEAAIRKISAQGQVTTVVEKVALTGCASIPSMPVPELRGLAVAADGTVYVAASGCGRVIKVTPAGQISTVFQTESPWSPTAVALSGKDVYVQEYLHTEVEDRRQWVPRVRKISADGTNQVIATVSRSGS